MIGMHDLAHVAIKVEPPRDAARLPERKQLAREAGGAAEIDEPEMIARAVDRLDPEGRARRSEEHTSELQSLMRISYAVFCLQKKHSHTPARPVFHSTETLDTHHHTMIITPRAQLH